MQEVFVVSAVRTPVGKQKGYLRAWASPLLLGTVLDAAVARAGIEPHQVDDVIAGTVYQLGEQGFTLARMAVLASGLPDTVPGMSINRQCGSSLSAIQTAHGMIAAGNMDVVLAAGCEKMSRYTISSDLNGTLYTGEPMGNPFGKFYTDQYGPPNQIVAAQKIADKWGLTRAQCMEYAVASHQKAARATDAGYFKTEILPMHGLDQDGHPIRRTTDETIRAQTSIEVLEALKVLPGTTWITAGLSSTITDGASALLLMSARKVRELKVTPLVKIKANVVVGSDPELMLTGPIPATRKILQKTGLTLEKIDFYEVNEAFAPIPLAWQKELQADPDRLNVNGGALALGHPVGNSGCRLAVTAIHELLRRKARYVLVTLCTGGGMAPATVFETA